jgi:hydroxybutyrate-dimer hydrolase
MFRIGTQGMIAALFLGLVVNAHALHPKPSFIKGAILCASYDGEGDDLLTAGLGKSGLQGATAPGFADANHPTAAELRRRAIYINYRALVDISASGGYGELYGPNIDANGNKTSNEGKIAGEECLAFADDGSGRNNVTMMVQIPVTFDPEDACIVAAPSSGSRGVYGAIATAGEWGLKHGCAVAYTDKGTGMGAHDLQHDTVNLIDGLRATASAAGKTSHFTARIDPATLTAFNARTPHRFAFKHAHSRQNPERDWGRNVLQSIELAFFLLNERFGDKKSPAQTTRPTLDKANTLVIASSVSNGGGASLRAAELDRAGLIDGVAVGEPQIQSPPLPFLAIRRGGVPVASFGRGLLDYTTTANLLQPCAALAPANTASPLLDRLDATRAAHRCTSLAEKGIIRGATLADRANDALAKLRASGWEADSDLLQASHYLFATSAVAVTYANTYARASVVDHLCGFSFGATDPTGKPGPAAPAAVAQIFANGNGIPPTSGISIINNDSPAGPQEDAKSTSPSTNTADFNLDGALCLRNLALGQAAVGGAKLSVDAKKKAERVRASVRSVRATGHLHGKPTLIVHGRSDTLVPVNHAARAYYGLNQRVERRHSRLAYYEVTNAQHFDAFLAFPGYDTRLIPLHYYFVQAMDLLYDHLKQGAALPPSQVVRTTPRGGTPGAAPAMTRANVPPIPVKPIASDLIEFDGMTLDVPN